MVYTFPFPFIPYIYPFLPTPNAPVYVVCLVPASPTETTIDKTPLPVRNPTNALERKRKERDRGRHISKTPAPTNKAGSRDLKGIYRPNQVVKQIMYVPIQKNHTRHGIHPSIHPSIPACLNARFIRESFHVNGTGEKAYTICQSEEIACTVVRGRRIDAVVCR
ncbi:uncharacterized protein EI97DRAFT_132551 [Westerdykella ornata]|uniref:Uncharacterized protein n=1 Tax=Westerdykella ornata TaxID=318751 RepID=A0A6A6JDL2_WESOR|nr:uncharacterized protein EI97DRAFT_132551 [Westerdykella ornata]KAF2274263.1 hypothetical protein EI97DRAFT_132551 [Westerdykella ornata]